VRNVVIVRLCACFVRTAEVEEPEDVFYSPSFLLYQYRYDIYFGDGEGPVSVWDSGELGREALQWSFTVLLCYTFSWITEYSLNREFSLHVRVIICTRTVCFFTIHSNKNFWIRFESRMAGDPFPAAL